MSDTTATCIAGKGASDTDTRMVIPAREVETGDLMNFSFGDPDWKPVEAISRRKSSVRFEVAGVWRERGAENPREVEGIMVGG